ncbi:MAG: hypothetical protein CVT65_16375 [Actinobacteria bacterium HGW-Actinobacteria-5]|jgi:uncharacterized membrane protein|nr:MAG: hypothetical protein CVT65_16375 [Actinobacteria bacterium HGW-Actinobacteria-5]
MTFGPADLYVVEFPAGSSPAEVTATLRDVTTAGVVTLLDVAAVRRGPDGTRAVLELDEFADELGLAGVNPAADGLIGEDDLMELTEALGDGSTALVVLLENTWARKVVKAVQDASAEVLSVERFTADVVNEVAALAV